MKRLTLFLLLLSLFALLFASCSTSSGPYRASGRAPGEENPDGGSRVLAPGEPLPGGGARNDVVCTVKEAGMPRDRGSDGNDVCRE